MVAANERVTDPRRAAANTLLALATTAEVDQAMFRHYCLHPESRPDDGKRYAASDRALRKWRRFERDGLALYGNGFVGLLPSIRKRGNRNRKLDACTLEIMHEVINTEVTSPAAKGLANCWANVRTKCKAAGVLAPSQKTFVAEVKRLLAPEDFKKAREGEKAGYDLELPFLSLTRETPKHGTRPFDHAHIDHTELDLQFVDEETGVNMGKAWLTVMMDPYTREVLAWVLLFDPPSYRSCMLVIRRCVKRHGRLPSTIVVDHGSDFISVYFDRLLAFLGVNKRLRPKSHPRFGSVVERFFGLTNEQFVHNLLGNNKALQHPRRMSPSHDPRELAIWNLRAFSAAFQGYLDTVYHAVEHPALGLSPLKARELGLLHSGARRHTWIVYDRNFVIATLPTTAKGTVRIGKDGSFKVQKIEFFAHELRSYAGKDLDVRHDPFDVSHAFVRGDNGWIEGLSLYADQLAGRSAKEIAQLSLEISANHSRDYARTLAKADAIGALNQQVKVTESLLASELQATRDRIQRGAGQDGTVIDVPANEVTNVVSFPEKKLPRDHQRERPKLPSNYKFEILEDF
jgi:transposase InsO family protein